MQESATEADKYVSYDIMFIDGVLLDNSLGECQYIPSHAL